MNTRTLSIANFLNAEAGPEIERRTLAGRRRRALVLTNESVRHPFRASLPPHVTQSGARKAPVSLWRLTKDDVRGFVTTYFAVFAAVFAFIL